MKSPLSDDTPPNELAVVGENKDDPSELLLLGTDGKYYAYLLPAGAIQRVEPDEQWEVEPAPPREMFS